MGEFYFAPAIMPVMYNTPKYMAKIKIYEL